MNRAVLAGTAAAFIAAAGGGFIIAQRPLTHALAVVTPADAQEAGAPIYYQDPDGKPAYSSTPKKTPDGRDYRAVPADADVSFEDLRSRADAGSELRWPYRAQDQVLPQSDGTS